MKGRSAGLLAATGGILPLIFLVSGINTAKADDVADLKANQDVLQRRVDQLAQGIPGAGSLYPGGPPNPVAGQPAGAGSFPRSFQIPGTDTSLRVGGNIYMDATTFFTGGNPNQNPQTNNTSNNGTVQALPLNGSLARSRGNGTWQFTPNRTNITFETRTPTAYGEARTYLEWDFSSNAFTGADMHNTDNLTLRLRFAYATLGGFLAGQANSNFADPDASIGTLSFGGVVGDPGPSRIPQIRYTQPLAAWGLPGAISFSAEAPETDGQLGGTVVNSDQAAATITANPVLGCTVANPTLATETVTCNIPGNLLANNPYKSKAPDLTMAWYIPQPWGHVDFSAVLRPDLAINDGLYVRRDFVGYGLHIGADVKPRWFGWDRDDITFQMAGGDGIGRYLSGNTTFFSLASNYPAVAVVPGSTAGGSVGTLAAANNIRVTTTTEFGGNLGYLHYWTPTLRSNIGAGFIFHDIPSYVGAAARGSLNRQLTTAVANLIWSPVSFVDVGMEYMYGYRQVMNKQHGDSHSLQGQFRVRF